MSSALTRTAALEAIVALLTGTAFASPRPMLVVGGDHENPPYEYLEDGKPTGFDVELMRAAAEIAGFDVQTRLGPWAQARRDLEEGKIDALSGMYFSEERSKLVDFSVPHTMVRSALFVREDSPIRSFADLRGKEVILQEGDVRHDLLQRTGIASRIIAVTDADEQLRLLASGRGDCALMTSRLQGEYYVKRLRLEKLRIIDADLPQLRYCFAVRKGNTELLDRLDEALNVLRVSGKYREIHERWFGVYEKTDLWKYGKYFAFTLAILTALLAASLLWSRTLRRQVRNRTEELRRAQAEVEQRVEERTAELRRANTQLRVSEAEKALVLNSTADLVTFLDPEMRIQWGNHQAAALARTTVDGLEGRRCFEAFHGRSAPCPGCPAVLARSTGQPQAAELPRPGGRTVFLRAYPVKDEQERVLGVAEFSLDITARKRMEEALRESEEWLKLTIEATGAGTFHTVPYGPPTFSPRHREMLGIPDDSAVADFEGFLRLVHPEDRERVRSGTEKALDPSGDGLLDTQFRCVRPDGSERWIARKAKAQFAEVGGARRAVRFAGVALDITDRKREEQALRESEARHARVAATVPGVLYEFARYPDGSGRFTYLSPRCPEILEVDGQALLDDFDVLYRMMDPADVRALEAGALAASRTRTSFSVEVRITAPSGRTKWIQFTSLPASTSPEGIEMRSGLILDVTERKRMEEALRESEEWLKLTVEATGAGILNTVPFGPPTLSPRYRQMLGLPDDFRIDDFEAFLRLVHPDDRETFRARALAALDPSGDGRAGGVFRCLRLDGSVRWLASTAKTQFAEVDGALRAVRFAAVALDVTDSKREEEALLESEERFHTLADNIAQLAWMANAQGEIFWFNRRCLDYTGAQADALQLGPFLHPDHVGRVAEKMSRSLSTGEVFEDTFPLRGKDGRHRWFLSRALPVRDGAGEVVRWLGTATDVTEQRDVEEALRESEARGRAILASLAEGVILHDADGRVTTANEAAEKLLGVPRDEMAGHTIFDGPLPGWMLRPDGRPFPPEEHPVTLALQTGSGHGDVEFGMRRPDGSVVWLAGHAQPVRLPDGRLAGVVSSLFDVTQRRQALQRSEGHLRTMADSVPDSIIRFDRALRHSFANQAAAAVIGLPLQRLVGKTRGELGMTPEHVAFWDQYLLKAFRTGAPDRFEFGLDGGRHYESRLIPERGPDGEVESVISITRDITERKQAEQQLLASREQLRALVARLDSVREEEKAQLSREIHDEMGQLLTALRMELEIIEDRLGDPGMPDKVRELLERAVAASELVAKTIQSMRSILSSLRPAALDRLGLEPALRQECRRFQEWAGVACELVATCGLSSFGAEVDTALFRIAQEALTNVARHAAASRVAVSLERRSGAAVLRVADDGRGIPAGHESIGLGLLGMRERAERLGGELAVRPVPRGGTMVEARIPVDAATSRKEVT